MMTRKHFIALARGLAHVARTIADDDRTSAREKHLAHGALLLAAQEVADVCRASNASFDRARFMHAAFGSAD